MRAHWSYFPDIWQLSKIHNAANYLLDTVANFWRWIFNELRSYQFLRLLARPNLWYFSSNCFALKVIMFRRISRWNVLGTTMSFLFNDNKKNVRWNIPQFFEKKLYCLYLIFSLKVCFCFYLRKNFYASLLVQIS